MSDHDAKTKADGAESASTAGLGIMPTCAEYLANATEFGSAMATKYVNVCHALKQECRDADELLKLLRLDPERYRTDGGYINLPKVRAALANPDDYPMMPNVEFSGGAPLHGAASAGTQGSASDGPENGGANE